MDRGWNEPAAKPQVWAALKCTVPGTVDLELGAGRLRPAVDVDYALGSNTLVQDMPPKVRDIIRLIEQDGWFVVRTKGSHRQCKHPAKPGRVTIAGNLGDDLAPGTL